MNQPEAARLLAAMEATWPPAEVRAAGPWTLRRGDGGGKRVSAATLAGAFDPESIAQAEAGMAEMGQPALFCVREGDDALDAALAARGYGVVDPVALFCGAVGGLLRPDQPPLAAVTSAQCLGIQAEIWAAGGIGPGRLAVMARAPGPKTWILGRQDGRAAGTAFAALDGGIAMIHAIEVSPDFRGRGTARAIMHRAAKWARGHGADWLALAVTEANTPAIRLYEALGMAQIGGYHYRLRA